MSNSSVAGNLPSSYRLAAAGYRADIDGLRAVAVLLVLVFHFDLVNGLKSGFMGVDLFFVISGFLITGIVNRQLQANTFQLSTFWAHRIRRLAPALVATTALTLAAGWLLLFPADFIKLSQQVIATQLYVANIFYWRNVNYFGLHAQDIYLLHTWSLAVEEQFYLFFPLLLLAVAKYIPRKLLLVICVLAVISFGLNMAFVVAKPEGTFYLLPTRAWELMVGSLVSVLVGRVKRSSDAAAETCGIAGVAFLVTAIALYREDVPFPGAFALLPVLSAALFIAAGSIGAGTVSRLMSLRFFVYIGRISYPLYLAHWPIHVFAGGMLGSEYGWWWRLLMFFTSLLSASLIFHCVEFPSQRRLNGTSGRSILLIYGLILFAIISVSIAILASDGTPSRFPERVSALASFAGDTPPPMHECEYQGTEALRANTMCRLGASEQEPNWIVYGDSHAWAAALAISQWLKSSGQSAYFVFLHACPPVRGVYVFRQGKACFQFNEAVLALAENQPSTMRILQISTWRQAAEGALSDSPTQRLSMAGSILLFDRQFAATLSDLQAMGKQVYVWEPLPGARFSVPEAMARNEAGGRQKVLDFTREEYLKDFGFFFDVMKSQSARIAGTFSPSHELCGSGRCVTSVDGKPLYFDNAHLSYSMQGFWAAALARQLPGQPS